jgi:hypothetical protein
VDDPTQESQLKCTAHTYALKAAMHTQPKPQGMGGRLRS